MAGWGRRPVSPSTTDIGPKPRAEGPHAHGAAFSPDNRFALVADRGLDQVLIYRYDRSTGHPHAQRSAVFRCHSRRGPRHLLFHPNGRILYELNETGSTITVLAYGAAGGTMSRIQEITHPPGRASQEPVPPPSFRSDRAGKFLYASNRGADNIAVFAIDPAKGTLTPVEHVSTQGKTPRDFSLDPTGRYLFAANQNSDTIVLFRVDPKTGRLTPTGQVVDHVPEPACVVFVPAQ